MARKRPTASDVPPLELVCLDGGKPDGEPAMTRAQARALLRSAPLTQSQLEKHFKGIADDGAGATIADDVLRRSG